MSKKYDKPELLPTKPTAIAVAVSTAIAGTNTAYSQGVLEEVIVTATKRETSLQDIPMSITAFTDDDIVHEGFKQIDDYVGKIPGLTVNTREPGGANVIMRGCAVSAVNFGGTSTTSLYLDEQPITSAGFNPDPRLVDIQRVEALSGPQGSLFGDAAECGTLRIITNKPDASTFEGWADVTGSQIQDGDAGYDFNGMVNIPLIEDQLALRLVGFHAEEAGFIDNIAAPSLGPPLSDSGAPYDNAAFVEDDVNSTEVTGGRVGLRWMPNDSLTLDAQAIYQKTTLDGFGDVDLNEGVHAGFGIGELEQVRYLDDQYEDEWYQLALTAEARLGFADVTMTGSFLNRKARYDTDATAYAFSLATQPDRVIYSFYDFGERTNFANDDSSSDTWTFEARVATPSDSASRWSGILGFFYNKSDDHTVFTSNGTGLADGCVDGSPSTCYAYHAKRSAYLQYYYYGTFGSPSDNWWTGDYLQTIENVAVFGEVSFDVTDNFSITAGGRWYEIREDRELKNGPRINLPEPRPTPALNCHTDAEQEDWQTNGVATPRRDLCFNDAVSNSKEDGFVPKINATYTFENDNLVYFTYSEGFRRGGVNAAKQGPFASGGNLHRFDSDGIENFEVGFKSTWLDNSLGLNATFYHMIWNDVQIQVNDPTGAFFALGVVNLAEAEIDGVEANFSWLPSENWNFSGNLGYNDASLSQDIPDAGFGVALSKGERLPLMAKWKTSLSGEYTFSQQIFNAEPYVFVNWNYRSDSLNSLAGLGGTTSLNPTRIHPDYHTVDFRAGLHGDDWSATFFIDNVFNDHSVTLFNTRWVQERGTINQPRTFGINFRKNFGRK